MLRFFFIEYGTQDEIETSYEEGCNRIQKTFDTILRLVDFPFDPGGGGGGWGKKTVSRCKNTFFLPRSRRLSPRRDGIYMHDSRKLNGSTSDRGHLFNCTKQTVHARWKIHAPSPPPLSYRIRKLAGRRGQIGLSAIKHGIRSNRSERASSFIFIGSTPSPARHTCPLLTILPADCKIPHSADRSPARRHPDPVSNHIKSRRLSIDRGR